MGHLHLEQAAYACQYHDKCNVANLIDFQLHMLTVNEAHLDDEGCVLPLPLDAGAG